MAALYWMLDSGLDAFVFHEHDFLTDVFSPDPMCLWMRIVNGAVVFILAAYAQSILAAERKLAEEKSRTCHDNLEQSVRERTAELQTAISRLTDEIDSRIKAEAALKNNQEKIKHMHGMKITGEMAAAVAHEVRNPLHALTSVTEALQQELKGNAGLDIYLRHIHEQVQRLSVLMKDLLDLGKPIDKARLGRAPLSEICSAAINSWKNLHLGRENDVKLVYPEDHAGIYVIADRQRLQQAFLNLLDNAARHSEEGREIAMIMGGTDLMKMVKVRVVDSGSGIPGDSLSRVFDPFFSTRRGATGLGLNIAKNIVESHGGDLILSNNTPLQGCTAEVNLPVAEEGIDETGYPRS